MAATSPLRKVLRMTSAELEQLLALQPAQSKPNSRRRPQPEIALAPDTGRRPRPSREFRRLSEEDRRRLLGRETQECGPGVLLTRMRAIIEARQMGDPRALAGCLEDLAAASLSWADRTINDMRKPPTL